MPPAERACSAREDADAVEGAGLIARAEQKPEVFLEIPHGRQTPHGYNLQQQKHACCSHALVGERPPRVEVAAAKSVLLLHALD